MGIILPGTDEVIGPGEHRFPYQASLTWLTLADLAFKSKSNTNQTPALNYATLPVLALL